MYKKNSNAKLIVLIASIALLLMTTSCEKDPETITVTETVYVDTCSVDSIEVPIESLNIGEMYEGGIIFYVDQSGEHGLICSINNISNSSPWGCAGTSIPGADGTVIGSGNQNSMDILDACPADQGLHASFEALIFGSGGFDDWYLPSKDELNEIYTHRFEIEDSGASFNGQYWTSSEVNADDAWIVNFSNGGSSSAAPKDINFGVRAVRAF